MVFVLAASLPQINLGQPLNSLSPHLLWRLAALPRWVVHGHPASSSPAPALQGEENKKQHTQKDNLHFYPSILFHSLAHTMRHAMTMM